MHLQKEEKRKEEERQKALEEVRKEEERRQREEDEKRRQLQEEEERKRKELEERRKQQERKVGIVCKFNHTPEKYPLVTLATRNYSKLHDLIHYVNCIGSDFSFQKAEDDRKKNTQQRAQSNQ